MRLAQCIGNKRFQFVKRDEINRTAEADALEGNALSAGIAQRRANRFLSLDLRHAIRLSLLQALLSRKLRAGVGRGLGIGKRGSQRNTKRHKGRKGPAASVVRAR
jgi:hypothetical protein